MIKKIYFKDIVFNNFKNDNFDRIISKKGLFLFPSGPGLSTLEEEIEYHNSLKEADYVFFDSGYFVLLLRIFKNIKVNKYSGYKFLEKLFEYLKNNNNKSIFCIDPNRFHSNSNQKYFQNIGIKKTYNYLAPRYNHKNIKDDKLLKKLNIIKPNFIITNIGGGTQEILGLYLKKKLKFKTSIICTGGAISFFTGDQAPIGNVVDKLFLGWLVRIIYNPQNFLLRYIKAFNLIRIFFKYKNTIKIKK
tara:strand:- start:351 stop:1088 length:738 start_codon:yes stop_codon:yes gene_type:complete